jgi:hypothetical protein
MSGSVDMDINWNAEQNHSPAIEELMLAVSLSQTEYSRQVLRVVVMSDDPKHT